MKIISVNIEATKHIPKIRALIKREKPDVLFLQEVCEKNIADFSTFMSGSSYFTPMAFKDVLDDKIGIAVFSTLPAVYAQHLLKEADRTVNKSATATFEDRFKSQSYYAIEATITDSDGALYRFYNTHLPVTEKGCTTDFQLSVVETLLDILSQKPEAILVGDSNAPRGGEAFSRISTVYKDNIPEHYSSSLDNVLHRAGPLEWLVDVLFTSPEYNAVNVTLISGVSDHCAVSAEVFNRVEREKEVW